EPRLNRDDGPLRLVRSNSNNLAGFHAFLKRVRSPEALDRPVFWCCAIAQLFAMLWMLMLGRVAQQIIEKWGAQPETSAIAAADAGTHNKLVVTGSRAGAAPALLALLGTRAARSLLVVTSSLERAESLTDGLAFFGLQPLIFPSFETLPFETAEPVIHILSAR